MRFFDKLRRSMRASHVSACGRGLEPDDRKRDGVAAEYDVPASDMQIYRGYSSVDLRVFDRFAGQVFEPRPGFVTDFLGVQTRASFLSGLSAPHGAVMGLPIPADHIHAETVEWVGLLKSVLAARDRFVFVFMRDHVRNNGFDPDAHTFVQATVGVESGRAWWPVEQP